MIIQNLLSKFIFRFFQFEIRCFKSGMKIRHSFLWIRIRLSWKKNPGPDLDPTLNRNEEKNIYLFFR